MNEIKEHEIIIIENILNFMITQITKWYTPGVFVCVCVGGGGGVSSFRYMSITGSYSDGSGSLKKSKSILCNMYVTIGQK